MHSHTMDHDHDHGHMDMCSMNMLFTWDTTNLCIVFRQWHVRSTASLVVSLVAVVLLGMGYEAIRSLSRRYEAALQLRIDAMPSVTPSDDDGNGIPDESPAETVPLFLRAGQHRDSILHRGHLVKALLYGLQNFYALMLMLVFMTYNGWVMMAVSLGAFFGYLAFGNMVPATKDTACH